MANIFKNKKILVTGGSGTIGKALAIRALKEGAKQVKVFSNDENGQYEMEKEIGSSKKVEFLIGDIRDEDRVHEVVSGSDIVFHAAALKHVDRCEHNPFEAVMVNIMGTKNVIRAAEKERVEKVISISTDKAVNPVSVMGATKLLGEKLIAAETLNKNSKTIFSSVRFGNVLVSRGSILPQIEKQIQKGGPITLTDKGMKRFFMTVDQAVDLIISATNVMKGSETFVLKMPLMNLEDLFEVMRDMLAPKYGFKSSQVSIKVIGKRPGEKLVEDLITDFDTDKTIETNEFFIIPHSEDYLSRTYPKMKNNSKVKKYFDELKPLTKKEIKNLLETVY